MIIKLSREHCHQHWHTLLSDPHKLQMALRLLGAKNIHHAEYDPLLIAPVKPFKDPMWQYHPGANVNYPVMVYRMKEHSWEVNPYRLKQLLDVEVEYED